MTSRPRNLQLTAWMLCGSIAPGCTGYYSKYVPPDPYRARAVWQDDGLVVVGAGKLPICDVSRLATLTPPSGDAPPPPSMYLDAQGQWRPVMVNAGFYFEPWNLLLLQEEIARKGLAYAASGGELGSSSADSSGGDDIDLPDGEGLAILAAVILVSAIVASVPLALGLAASDPEDDVLVAGAIDRVNRYNDALRRWITECGERAQTRVAPVDGATDPRSDGVRAPGSEAPPASDGPERDDVPSPPDDVPPPPGVVPPRVRDVPPPPGVVPPPLDDVPPPPDDVPPPPDDVPPPPGEVPPRRAGIPSLPAEAPPPPAAPELSY